MTRVRRPLANFRARSCPPPTAHTTGTPHGLHTYLPTMRTSVRAAAAAALLAAAAVTAQPSPSSTPVGCSSAAGPSRWSGRMLLTDAYISGGDNSGMLATPTALAVARDGSVLYAELGRVRRIATSGQISTIAGSWDATTRGDGGPATLAMFYGLGQIALGPDDTLFIADAGDARVRRVGRSDGIITTYAGGRPSASSDCPSCVSPGCSEDGWPATCVSLGMPSGLAADNDGNVYMCVCGLRLDRDLLACGASGSGDPVLRPLPPRSLPSRRAAPPFSTPSSSAWTQRRRPSPASRATLVAWPLTPAAQP